jgi:hypothetical protein
MRDRTLIGTLPIRGIATWRSVTIDQVSSREGELPISRKCSSRSGGPPYPQRHRDQPFAEIRIWCHYSADLGAIGCNLDHVTVVKPQGCSIGPSV